jgi:epoxyqueuosine reductase QueG
MLVSVHYNKSSQSRHGVCWGSGMNIERIMENARAKRIREFNPKLIQPRFASKLANSLIQRARKSSWLVNLPIQLVNQSSIRTVKRLDSHSS